MFSFKLDNIFLILFSVLPVSLLIGPSLSLANIIIIDVLFLIQILKNKNFEFLNNRNFKYLIFLYIYLLLNTAISEDYNESFVRNFGFIRIIIFFLAFNYFAKNKSFLKKILISWLLIFLIVVFDVFFESITGSNVLGFKSEYGNRVVSFFKNEPVVGGYLNTFFLILVGFLLNHYKEKNYGVVFLLSLIFLISIIYTGERSNTIKAMLGLVIFYFIFPKYSFKIKLISLIFVFTTLISIILNSDFLKLRFVDQISELTDKRKNPYHLIYKSGYHVFQDNFIFGVGNKNYRVVACDSGSNKNYICQTHPHQIYLEFLSEHGIIGSGIILYLLYKIIFSKVKIIIKNKNYIQTGSCIYLLMVFLPLIPSGAFFSDFSLTLFAINLSIMYASDGKTNVFKN